jgi:3-methylornithine--L-lysine ligase
MQNREADDMRLCIIGGGLYGMEAAYLARKAGYDTCVMDRDLSAPAASLTGNDLLPVDPVKEPEKAARLLSDFDAVMPVSSNVDLVMSVMDIAESLEKMLLLDPDAYMVSSSRAASDLVLQSLGIRTPNKWPDCGYPAVMKPTDNSRKGETRIVHSEKEAKDLMYSTRLDEGAFMIQQYIEGKTVSVEIMGDGSTYQACEISKSEFDDRYDCKRVICSPEKNDSDDRAQLKEYGCSIAEDLCLKGLMSVEAIMGPRGPVVIDINERIPCRSPSAVLWSTGINMLEEDVWISSYSTMRKIKPKNRRTAICEHILVENGRATVCGKHGLGKIGDLRLEPGLFGFDDVITDYSPDSERWMMTAIVSGNGRNDTAVRRDNCIARMMGELGVRCISDPVPSKDRTSPHTPVSEDILLRECDDTVGI